MAGRRGPTPKPGRGDVRHWPRPIAPTVLTGAAEEERAIPEPPSGLLTATRRSWAAFWRSPVSQAITEVDHPALIRLFTYYDDWARMSREVRVMPFVTGSKGQVVAHPAAGRMDALESHVRRLETELGLTPLARSRLGIAFGQAKLTAAEVNRMSALRVVEGDLADPDADLRAEFEEPGDDA